jgi:hypothetical protein
MKCCDDAPVVQKVCYTASGMLQGPNDLDFPFVLKIRWLGRLGIVGIDSRRTLNIVLHDMEETLQYIAQFSKYLSGQSNIFICPLSKK